MKKEQILEQIEALKAALATCDCSDESPVFVPKSRQEYYYIDGLGTKDAEVCGADASSFRTEGLPAFRSEAIATDYAKAFETLLKLRAQKGVVPMVHGTWQYLIEGFSDGNSLQICKRRDAGVKQSRSFSPAFENESDANAALSAVGKDNIIKAMKVLAWG